MTSKDTADTLELALQKTGFDNVTVKNRPRLLSDNGPSYVSEELADWLQEHGIEHTRGKPYHPQTQDDGQTEALAQTSHGRLTLIKEAGNSLKAKP